APSQVVGASCRTAGDAGNPRPAAGRPVPLSLRPGSRGRDGTAPQHELLARPWDREWHTVLEGKAVRFDATSHLINARARRALVEPGIARLVLAAVQLGDQDTAGRQHACDLR